jgi:hypothetical protein
MASYDAGREPRGLAAWVIGGFVALALAALLLTVFV